MKVYLAARYSRHPELQGYAHELFELGHEVTATWIWGGHDIRANGHAEEEEWQPIWAAEDWNDMMRADMVISFTEGPGHVDGRARGGRHVEFGAALVAGKRVIVVGYRENVFHHLPEVEFYPDWPSARAAVTASVQQAAEDNAAAAVANAHAFAAEVTRYMRDPDAETELSVRLPDE